jgi:hypothetical protein
MVPFFSLHKLRALMKGRVPHNECYRFTFQNCAYVKKGCWTDQQAAETATVDIE